MLTRLFMVSIFAIVAGLSFGHAYSETNKTFSWDIPTTRVDGTAITTDEIAGYRFYKGATQDSLSFWTSVAGGAESQTTIIMETGNSYVGLTAVDTDGNESGMSNILHVVVPSPPSATTIRIMATSITLDSVNIIVDPVTNP